MNNPDHRHGIRASWRLAMAGLLIAVALPAAAQQPSTEQIGAIRQACRADYQAHCAGVPTGGSAALACLQKNAVSVSPACRRALQAVSASASPAAASGNSVVAKPSSPAGASAAATTADSWPHTVRGAGGSAIVYQPQVVSWVGRQTLRTRIAVALTPTGAKAAVLGTIEVGNLLIDSIEELATAWRRVGARQGGSPSR